MGRCRPLRHGLSYTTRADCIQLRILAGTRRSESRLGAADSGIFRRRRLGVAGSEIPRSYLYTKLYAMTKSGYDRCYMSNRARRTGDRNSEGESSAKVSLTVNGKSIEVAEGTSIAAAVMMAGEPCRYSVEGEARAPLCGMGICMECRVTVNGVANQRSCQLICAPGMEVMSR